MPGSNLFRCKNIDQLLADAEAPKCRLNKSLGWLSLAALGILFSLLICAILYIGVAIVLTGIQPGQSLRDAAPDGATA